MRTPILMLAAVTLAACSQAEEPVANRFDRTSAELENKARALDAEVENQVQADLARIQNEIDAFADQANLANAVEANTAEANGTR